MLTLAAASGNAFAYAWADEVPAGFEGPAWARALCPRGDGLGLDGLFLLQRPKAGQPWIIDHWEPDGAHTFCSNGTRAAAALLGPGDPEQLRVRSSGEAVALRREGERHVALRLPEGEGYGLRPLQLDLEAPHVYGWTGTPHLVLEVEDTETLDLPILAPPLRHHPALPEGANVSFVQVLEPGLARIRSWERGVEGETLCCGQGCCVAGAWLARRTGHAAWRFRPRGRDEVHVSARPGPEGSWHDLWLGGPIRVLGRLEPGPDLLRELP